MGKVFRGGAGACLLTLVGGSSLRETSPRAFASVLVLERALSGMGGKVKAAGTSLLIGYS